MNKPIANSQQRSDDIRQMERVIKILEDRMADKKAILLRGCSDALALKVRGDVIDIEQELTIAENKLTNLKKQQ